MVQEHHRPNNEQRSRTTPVQIHIYIYFYTASCALGKQLNSGQIHPHRHITWPLKKKKKKTLLVRRLAQGQATQLAQWNQVQLGFFSAPAAKSSSSSSLCLGITNLKNNNVGLDELKFSPRFDISQILSP